ncbi:MAG: PP2C family protein-serine/threonine phosphatase [Clostridiales bacterium]|jgi:sigma-B regulation protein RsbU (phosphoserine phosphatase)|nr:PP2C family protein-serine/threonine phosphatase [Clostridiales bacterium]
MRPAGALPPALGLMLGVPGAIGCALGNLAADILSGYAPELCAWGLAAQFVFGFFPILLWRFIQRRAKEPPSALRLNNVRNIIRYLAVIIINALLMAAMLGLIFQAYGLSGLLSTTSAMLLLNNIVFGVILGIPIVIFISQARLWMTKGRMSLSERFVLLFILLNVVAAGIVGVAAYIEISPHAASPLAMWNTIYLYIVISISALFIITVFILRNMERNITVPIEGIAAIAKGYVSKERHESAKTAAAKCEAFTHIGNETGMMAEAFRTMILDLETYIANLSRVTAEKERIGAELDVATKIQAGMLPRIFPPFPARPEFDIYAAMQPAKEVGGDFYDFFLIDDRTLAVVMADVSGKGVPAALFMVIAKTLIKNNAQYGKNPSEVFNTVNNLLCENNEADMFVTAFMGYLDIPSGRLTYVNAGHNPPLIFTGGRWEWLGARKNFILAGMENISYKQDEITMRPGDELFLYTDGVTEAVNAALELFGEARLMEVIKGNTYDNKNGLKERLTAVKQSIGAFADGAEQADDITMLALRIETVVGAASCRPSLG